MSDLVAFVRARLDEDEAVARRNTGDSGLADDGGTGPVWPDYATYTGTDDYVAADEYIARFRPTRVLREVEAGRAILDAYIGADGDSPRDRDRDRGRWDALHAAVCYLAAIYRDHPDYREEWAR